MLIHFAERLNKISSENNIELKSVRHFSDLKRAVSVVWGAGGPKA